MLKTIIKVSSPLVLIGSMLAFTSCGGDKPPVNVYTINLTQSASALDQTNNACNIDAKIFLDGNLVEDKVD
jgi:hypothetical protein